MHRLSTLLSAGALALSLAGASAYAGGHSHQPARWPAPFRAPHGAFCPGKGQEVKNIILFIGDGMQLEHEIATSRYLYGRDFGLVWHQFAYDAPVATWDVSSYNGFASKSGFPAFDLDRFVAAVGYDAALGGALPFPLDPTCQDNYFLRMVGATDSASAATAWATGFKTDSGNIAWLPGDPAGGALQTIAELMREAKGAAIGVVSTVPFTHATPAAHVAHNVNRNNYVAIAEEIIATTRPEVVIGGGHPAFTSGYMTPAQRDALAADAGYVFAERVAGVDGAVSLLDAARQAVKQKKKLFGVYGGPGGNFESPVPSHAPGAPSVARATIENPLLKDATVAALQVLSQDRDGFFVMIEQGDIDWANHSNIFNQMIGCTWDLDQAVKAAVAFVNKPGDSLTWGNTLLIVTSDHGNSYMRLRREDGVPVLGQGELPASQGTIAFDAATRQPVYAPADAPVFYGTGNHTDELVMLYAMGRGLGALADMEGEWYPGTNIIDNTQLFEAMAEAAGLPAVEVP